ncbi:MAG: hypothetical protein OXD42_04595 [Rhodospirillaceae bacterium]|nr:hypothetical protein [Rhodospirillaceae bacterium]
MAIGGPRAGEDRAYHMERRGVGVALILRETQALCGRYPEYAIVYDSEVLFVIPAAPHERSPARAVVSVRSGGRSLPGSDLLLLFPNRTRKQATTDDPVAHDRVRFRTGTCCETDAGLDTRRTRARDRSFSRRRPIIFRD